MSDTQNEPDNIRYLAFEEMMRKFPWVKECIVRHEDFQKMLLFIMDRMYKDGLEDGMRNTLKALEGKE